MTQKEYNHRYYLKHKEKFTKQRKEWYKNNKEYAKRKHREWAKKYPEKVKESKKRWTIKNKPLTKSRVRSAIMVLETVLKIIQ